MRNKILNLGLASLITVISVVPAFAASGDAYGNSGTTSSLEVKYNTVSDGFATDIDYDTVDYEAAWNGVAQDETEVIVSQAASFDVKIPKKITLLGTKGAANEAAYDITVNGNVPGDLVINVAPNTASAKTGGTQENNFDKTAGSGTFAMLEKAGIKKDITATITQADTTWTISDDGDGASVESITSATHAGKVAVANLTAGEWSNTINFDISATQK